MWQLPPPRGTFLGEVQWEWLTQCKTKKVAHTIHGQELIWGGSPDGIHGVTELVECERTQDMWLQSLQNEVRNGVLSEANHAFLHGFATPVPGSWNGQILECNQAACQKLLREKAAPEAILRLECDICKNERQSKVRVADGSLAASARFAGAKAIFATNAVKYHVNKMRAKAWAAETGQVLHHAIAKDRISSAALREKPDLGKEKLTWLQRHDQDCGSLYGVFPLCIGMPVAAAEHLDRSRGILRGCAGEIVGWVWHADAVGVASQEATQIWNELPACILVRFKTKTTWRVEGIDEDNVFPVAPQKKPWYLDKGRKRPVLRVTRKQFPLAPGFATTAHAAQGQTCKEGVVMDTHIGEAGDPLTAYIALTRVQDRYGLFVYRPFPAAPFQKGAKVGRELLLRFWGGEKMDWSALRAKYRDERQCKECDEAKPASAFTAGRWKRADAARVCKECIRRHAEAQQPWQCMACTAWKQEDAFKAEHARPQATFYRICKTCEQTQVCSVCKTRKDEKKFSAGAWKRARTGGRVCLDCSRKAWGWWRCSVCKVQQAASAFESWLSQHRSCNGDQVCNCWKCPIPRRSISKAVQRVAATQAKVTVKAAEEKKARAIADVWAAIAERKRKREQDGATKEAEPKAAKCRQDDETEMPGAEMGEASAEEKRKRDMDNAETEDAERRAKKRKDGTHEAREGQPDLQAKEKEDPKPSDKTTVPAKEGKATQKRKLCEYKCPHCRESVTSTVRTGQVDHRRRCGNRFRVKDARVVDKAYVYMCPFCNGETVSNTRTGRIDHRSVCGNRFYVEEGRVSTVAKAYVYICPFCNGETSSNTKTGQINHRSICGNQFYVKEGRVSTVAKAYVYICPFCNGQTSSNTKTGRINHRSICGNQFYVKEGRVSRKTRRHAHSCPVCQTVVWSCRSFGQIHVNHDTPAGKPCKKTKWFVPQQKPHKRR